METVIRLTQGKETRVSQEDFAFLNKWKWYHHNCRGCFYADRNIRGPGKKVTLLSMHRVVAARMGLDLSNEIDHIDGDGLNNIRSNLRAATRAQNSYNRGKPRHNTSGIKGAFWDKARSKWKSQIYYEGTYHYLGTFDTKEKAAEAYRKAAERLHKDFYHV